MPAEYRRCRVCSIEKPLDDFHRDKNRALGRSYECKACVQIRITSSRGRELRRSSSKSRHQEGRAFLDSLKQDTPCADCGGVFPVCAMDFDHPDPSIKGFTIATWAGGGVSPKLLAELEKCDIICSNCHRVRTARQIQMGILRSGGRPRKTTFSDVQSA